MNETELVPPSSAGFGEHSFVGNAAGDAVPIEALEKWNNDTPAGAEQLAQLRGRSRIVFAQKSDD